MLYEVYKRGASLGAMDQKAKFTLSRNWEGLRDLMSWDPRFKSVMPALREAELNDLDEKIRDLAKACWTLYEVTKASAFYFQSKGSHTSLQALHICMGWMRIFFFGS